MKYGTQSYGINLARSLKRLERDRKYAARVAASQEKARKLTLFTEQWARIKSKDLPLNFINDKREYYRTVYLKSDHWKLLRARKLKVSPVCEEVGCGSAYCAEPHHLRYKNLYDVELEDLKTLCRKHHRLEHKRLEEAKRI